MIDHLAGLTEPVSAPPLAPLEQPIDLAHLARMTLGDASLEREILQLYDRQAEILLGRILQAPPAAAAAHAHTLKGSSKGVGAWRVACAAEALEIAAGRSADMAAAIAGLSAAIAEARGTITELLRAH